MRHLIAAVLLTLGLAACQHGQDFQKPSPETFVLGTTSRAEVVSKYGPPYTESTAVISDTGKEPSKNPFMTAPVGGSFIRSLYTHYDTTNTVMVGGAPDIKTIVFMFWNERLVGYSYVSDFAQDSSNFDETKIANIRKGQMTASEVVQLLGQPTGQLVYPLLQNPGDKIFMYEYIEINGRGQRERKAKTLGVLLTPEGIVRDYRFTSDTSPAPGPQGGSSFVPMIIPTKK